MFELCEPEPLNGRVRGLYRAFEPAAEPESRRQSVQVGQPFVDLRVAFLAVDQDRAQAEIHGSPSVR